MSTRVATRTTGAIARPPVVLVPLIRKELADGLAAGVEHYRRAGELLIEAKEGVPHGEWGAWLEDNFALNASTAQRYMRLARIDETEARTAERFSSVRAATRPDEHDKAPWYRPVQSYVAARVDPARLAKEARDKAHEAKLVRDLCEQIIAIGYKVLATKLHPDKREGSAEAMARLNRARAFLRGAL